MNASENKRNSEAHEALQRVESDSTSFITGSANTGHNRTFPEDKGAADPVVKWATRIGRTLGWIACVLLVINLFTHWFF